VTVVYKTWLEICPQKLAAQNITIWRDFADNLATCMIANISGLEQDIINRKTGSSRTRA